MRPLPAGAALLIGALGACFTGPSARTFPPARDPGGIAADLRLELRQGRLRGELLEVQDSALVVLRDDSLVTIVPIRAIRSGSFAKPGLLIANGYISRRGRERLRLVSRFPAGLTPELRARLLAAYGQTAPDSMKAP